MHFSQSGFDGEPKQKWEMVVRGSQAFDYCEMCLGFYAIILLPVYEMSQTMNLTAVVQLIFICGSKFVISPVRENVLISSQILLEDIYFIIYHEQLVIFSFMTGPK